MYIKFSYGFELNACLIKGDFPVYLNCASIFKR